MSRPNDERLWQNQRVYLLGKYVEDRISAWTKINEEYTTVKDTASSLNFSDKSAVSAWAQQLDNSLMQHEKAVQELDHVSKQLIGGTLKSDPSRSLYNPHFTTQNQVLSILSHFFLSYPR